MSNTKQDLTHAKSQLAMVVGLLVLGYIFGWTPLVYAATILGVVFLVLPSVGKRIADGWMKLAMFLGHWNGRILLTIVFFLFLTPLALLYRFFNKEKVTGDANSNYVVRNHTYNPEDLDKMW
jgi:hypothetical protein